LPLYIPNWPPKVEEDRDRDRDRDDNASHVIIIEM
jgi:hypothetical protein